MGELRGSLEHSEDEAFIIVKAAPRASQRYGETVCIAAIDNAGSWRRLYPVAFRRLATEQQFKRWALIRYRWRQPTISGDKRVESRRVDQDSIEIVGQLRDRDRHAFVNRAGVRSLKAEAVAGRSLALLLPEVTDFRVRRRSPAELERQRAAYDHMQAHEDLFSAETLAPREPCPFEFQYAYRDDDGSHVGTCQDWETEATFFRRRNELGEAEALRWMQTRFGEEIPAGGMALAMGTHRWHPGQWLINGVIQYKRSDQLAFL